jgi:hypothetical protein
LIETAQEVSIEKKEPRFDRNGPGSLYCKMSRDLIESAQEVSIEKKSRDLIETAQEVSMSKMRPRFDRNGPGSLLEANLVNA